MVLSVGCSSGSKLSSEEKWVLVNWMEYFEYFFENSFADNWGAEDEFNKLTESGSVELLLKYTQNEPNSEFSKDLLGVLEANNMLGDQRLADGVEKGDKETSEEYQNFVEKFNEVNEKYKLGFDKL